MPVMTDGQLLDTGIAVANVGSTAVAIRLKLFSEDGTLVVSIVPADLSNLQSLEHIARFVTELLGSVPGIAQFRGKLVIEVEGEGKIAVVGLMLKEGLLASLPVVMAQ